MWKKYFNATTTDEVLQLIAKRGEKTRVVAGGTDFVLEMKHGAHAEVETIVDISRVPGYDVIRLDDEGELHLGPAVTHHHCVASDLVRRYALPLAQTCWGVGAPQIRNRGTVVGNLVTASPANDTIAPLMALGAKLVLASVQGKRVVPLSEFYTGVRKTVLRRDELVVDVIVPVMAKNQRGTYQKLGLRKAQAISLVNMAAILTFDGEMVKDAVITLGSVAPTIVRAEKAEAYLRGHVLDVETVNQAAELASESARPIDDVRGSASYRREMVKVLVRRGLAALAGGQENAQLPDDPPLLWGQNAKISGQPFAQSAFIPQESPIKTTINGKEYVFENGHAKTLLDLIREDAGLTGAKEGCGEGECGACTVFLDGKAVMSCLVPAPRAHGAEIVTVEGISEDGELHPVQEAFVEEGAVQCGFCTPGFVMSSVKLLEEKPHPSRDQIKDAVSGNLCRCTGYYKIVQAIEMASVKMDAKN